MLTRSRLVHLLTYDRATGVFRWRINGRGKRIGQQAGCIREGYRKITVDGRQYRAARLAWLYVYGSFPADRVDHRDLDSLNDRIGNLRLCDHAQNMSNRAVFRSSTTGVKGVYRSGRGWVAIIQARKVRHYLGSFPDIDAAAAAYARAARSLHGDFART